MCTELVALQFGLSLLYALLSQGERLLSSDLPMEPSIGDFEIWYCLLALKLLALVYFLSVKYHVYIEFKR